MITVDAGMAGEGSVAEKSVSEVTDGDPNGGVVSGCCPMNTAITSSSVSAPAAPYELAMTVTAGSAMMFTAGIVGTRPDGTISDDIGEQAAEMWRTIDVLLKEAGYSVRDVVSYTTYAVVGYDLASVMAARNEYFVGHKAASTLIPVPALAQPQWKVEAAVVAAR
jgi:2-iminobutanoate/2-iminopropanoate deaminase